MNVFLLPPTPIYVPPLSVTPTPNTNGIFTSSPWLSTFLKGSRFLLPHSPLTPRHSYVLPVDGLPFNVVYVNLLPHTPLSRVGSLRLRRCPLCWLYFYVSPQDPSLFVDGPRCLHVVTCTLSGFWGRWTRGLRLSGWGTRLTPPWDETFH